MGLLNLFLVKWYTCLSLNLYLLFLMLLQFYIAREILFIRFNFSINIEDKRHKIIEIKNEYIKISSRDHFVAVVVENFSY